MSRSVRGSKGSGYEYWSRRPLNGEPPSPENKRITHGIERARARQEIMEESNRTECGEGALDVRAGLWLLGTMGEYFQPDGEDAECTVETIHDNKADSSYLRILHYTLMLHGY